MLTNVKVIEDQEEEKPAQPETPKKKTVEACLLCDNVCAFCRFGNDCSMEVEL